MHYIEISKEQGLYAGKEEGKWRQKSAEHARFLPADRALCHLQRFHCLWFFFPPSVWCEITAPLSTRCIFRFALPAVTHCFYLAFCCLHTTLVQPFKTLGPIVLHQSGWALFLSLLVIQIIHQTICQKLLTAHMIKGSGSNGIKGSYGFEYWIMDFIPLESKEYTCIDPERKPDCWVFKSEIPHDPFPCGRRMTWPLSENRQSSCVSVSPIHSVLYSWFQEPYYLVIAKKCLSVPCLLLSTKWSFVLSSTHLEKQSD